MLPEHSAQLRLLWMFLMVRWKTIKTCSGKCKLSSLREPGRSSHMAARVGKMRSCLMPQFTSLFVCAQMKSLAKDKWTTRTYHLPAVCVCTALSAHVLGVCSSKVSEWWGSSSITEPVYRSVSKPVNKSHRHNQMNSYSLRSSVCMGRSILVWLRVCACTFLICCVTCTRWLWLHTSF